MKIGLIIYVAGHVPEKCNLLAQLKSAPAEIQADAVEIMSREIGHADIHDAWWALQSKGMSHIVCKMAQVDDAGAVIFTGRELRLCG